MNTTKRSKLGIWPEMDLHMIETLRFIKLILNISLVYIEVVMKESIIFGSIIQNYFQDHMMDKEPCLSLNRWYFSL